MSNNLSTVKSIGRGVRLTEEAAAAIVASVPAEYDWTARGAVPAAIAGWAVPAGEPVPAQKSGPKGAQTLTDYGRGVDALAKAVRELVKDDAPKPVKLRATLSGEGGGSVVIPKDSPLYAPLVALIAEAAAE